MFYAQAALLVQLQALLRANAFLAKYRCVCACSYTCTALHVCACASAHMRVRAANRPPAWACLGHACRPHRAAAPGPRAVRWPDPRPCSARRPMIPSLKPLFNLPSWRIIKYIVQAPWEQPL